MKKGLIISTIILAVALIIATVFAVKNSRNKSFDNAINMAIEYISNNIDENGKFTYRNITDNSMELSPEKYSSLRHAGTLYSMYLCEKELKNKTLQEKRYLASEYFIKRYIKPVKDMYAVISIPEEEGTKEEVAKLGGAGLALVGLSNLYNDEKIDLKILTGLGDFIVSMQKEDGSFYSKYLLKQSKKDDSFKSRYYTGEAALGLLYLNEINPSEKWVNTAKKALLYNATPNKDNQIKTIDHWDVIAIKKLYEAPNVELTEKEKIILREYATEFAKAIVLSQDMNPKNDTYGSFKGLLNLNRIATYMEGISAGYYVINDKNLKNRIKESLKAGNSFLVKAQVKEGQFKGGIPYSAFWGAKHAPAKFKVIRIDNVQHTLSAWIMYSVLK